MAALINMAMLHRPYAFCRGPKIAPGSLSPFRLRRSTPFQSNLQRRLSHHFSPLSADTSFLNAPQRSPSGPFSTPPWFRWTPLRRGSGGRFGLRRFRAKQNPTPFVTHRAFTRTLPPSQASVQFLSPFRLFLSAGAQVKDKNRPETAERKKQ